MKKVLIDFDTTLAFFIQDEEYTKCFPDQVREYLEERMVSIPEELFQAYTDAHNRMAPVQEQLKKLYFRTPD